jgi:hypothetical protein
MSLNADGDCNIKCTYWKTDTGWRLVVSCHDLTVWSQEHEYTVSPQDASFQIQPLWTSDDIWHGTSVSSFVTLDRSHSIMLRSLDPDTHSKPDCNKQTIRFFKFYSHSYTTTVDKKRRVLVIMFLNQGNTNSELLPSLQFWETIISYIYI